MEKIMNNIAEILDNLALGAEYLQKHIASNDAHVGSIEGENTMLRLELNAVNKKYNLLLSDHEKLAAVLEQHEQAATKLLASAKKSDQMLAQANLERDQALIKVKDLTLKNQDYKTIGNTPKKVREKIKDLQTRLHKQTVAVDVQKQKWLDERDTSQKLRVEIAELTNRLDASAINQIYRDDKDIVQTYPYLLGDLIPGIDPRQTPLFYLHKSGRGGLVILNEHNEAVLTDAPKGGIRPKKSTLEHCEKWLRRAQANNWEIEKEDLQALAHGSK